MEPWDQLKQMFNFIWDKFDMLSHLQTEAYFSLLKQFLHQAKLEKMKKIDKYNSVHYLTWIYYVFGLLKLTPKSTIFVIFS